MTRGIHHTHYRVIPGPIPGSWTGECKICAPGKHKVFKNGFPNTAEEAIWEHLRVNHPTEAKEAK